MNCVSVLSDNDVTACSVTVLSDNDVTACSVTVLSDNDVTACSVLPGKKSDGERFWNRKTHRHVQVTKNAIHSTERQCTATGRSFEGARVCPSVGLLKAGANQVTQPKTYT